jgi:hypothetical protein
MELIMETEMLPEEVGLLKAQGRESEVDGAKNKQGRQI